MCIRPLSIEDAEEISRLIVSSVVPWKAVDFDDSGWVRFIESVSIGNTQHRIADCDNFSLCKIEHEKIAGVITVRDWEALDQLYVLPDYHKQGVASQLWEAARAYCIESGYGETFFVKSSTYAVPVYLKFGFRVCGPREPNNGMAYTPMSYACAKP